MKKRGVTEQEANYIFLIFIILLVIIVVVEMPSSPTSYAVYQDVSEENLWDFTAPSDYSYNSSVIEITNGDVALVSTTITTTWNTTSETEYALTSALYKPSDKTSKVNAQDNNKHEVENQKIFDMFFPDELSNGGVISLYIKDGDEGDLYLCGKGVICDSPGYGLVSYTEEDDDGEGWYNITISGLGEASSVFNLVVPEKAKIDYITSTEGDITQALYNPSDKTSKVNEQDNQKHEIDKNNFFNIFFDNSIANDDVISIYLKSGANTDIFLCDYGIACDSPGYGLVTYDGEEGWYNITVSGLSSAINSFNLDPDKVKIDYIKAAQLDVEEHSSANTTFPSSAEIETEDFSPDSWSAWETFSTEEEVNGQGITYQYSTDSGSTWDEVPADGDLSFVNSDTIRIKAVFASDTTDTPTLSSMTLGYAVQVCVEDWTCTDWSPEVCPVSETQTRICSDVNECGTEDDKPAESQSCAYVPTCSDEIKNQDETDIDCGGSCDSCADGDACLQDSDCVNSCINSICGTPCVEVWYPFFEECLINDTRINFYIDMDDCGTVNDLPADNGTSSSCDYCAPDWTEVNSSCLPENRMEVNFVDANSCYSITGLSSDNQAPEKTYYDCNYCSIYNCKNSFGDPTLSFQDKKISVDSYNATRTKLEITSDEEAESAYVSIIEYDRNIKNQTPSALPVNKYLDIAANISNISSVKIIIYYTDEELAAANIIEESLKVHYYNETSEEWEELDSVVNTTENYVYAIVSHFSLYGLFGETQSEESGGSSSSGSGGSGGGGSGGGSSAARNSISASSGNEDGDKLVSSIATTETNLKTNSETETLPPEDIVSERKCNYVLEISLPDELSFVNEESFTGEITNKANCAVSDISLALSPNLEEHVSISTPVLTAVKEDQTENFILIRKQEKKSKWYSFLTGSVITPLAGVESLEGFVILEGKDEQQVVFSKELPLKVNVIKETNILNPSVEIGWRAFIVIFILVMSIFFKRKTKK